MKTRVVERTGLLVCIAALAMAASGCAHYEYRVVQPVVPAPIGKQPVRVNYPPLMYQFSQKGDRLAMQINNPLNSPVTLVGNKSYLVAPTGETHPLRGAKIAPNSYMGMLLPPQLQVYRAYPTFGLGLGFGGTSYSSPFAYSGVNYYGGPYWSGPSDYYLMNPPNHWGWKTGEVRMLLFYQQKTNSFEHQFILRREKVK